MPYYFFNVPEELDAPGEWYLDRDECVLYMYPNGDIADSSIELALGFNDTIVSFDGCRYIIFDGFTLTGTRGSGLRASNVSDFTLSNCRFYNIGRNAVDGTGERCTVSECEVSYVGVSGISWSGGDKATLRRADNLIDNNLVTHWGLNTRTFTSAISGGGQGITISHNEMAYSTSNATGMTGNMNVLEYNLIHDCTRYASDCGAYYNGSSWTSGGCDIRYNCFYNIGSDMATPAAIFWDDGMAYQRAYKNLLLNISGYGISIGGGFGNAVVNNAIINTGKAPYLYDARPYNGNRQGDRFYAQDSSGFIWNLYKSTPYTTTVWRESFPLLAQVLQTSNDKIAPHFGFNPAFSLFTDNIFINRESLNGGVGVQHINYSTDIDNYVSDASVLADIFVDPEHGDYRLRDDSAAWSEVRDFEDIPYWKIGRY